MKKGSFFLIMLFFAQSAIAQSFPGGYNFSLPGNGGSDSEFLPTFEATEISNFLSINASGNFFDGNSEIRFWGINMTTEANFPDKAKADEIASRMRKMGINLVRFHHMDNPWSSQNGTIFDRSTGGTRKLHPTTLDRFHYFLYALKMNGIYANINLHVSRTFTEADGVSGADGIEDFGKAVTYYDPQLIELQKEFATQLLTSMNPYTGVRVADDPVVGMVEITNENTIYGWWKGDRLRKKSEGGSLINRHNDMLNDLWQEFLTTKYGDHNSLSTAWKTGTNNPGSQLIRDPGFESGKINENWQLELHETANGNISIDNNQIHTGKYSGKVEILNLTSTSWHFQFKQEGLSMTKDSSYVIRFYAKGSKPIKFNIVVQRGEDPWTYYGGTSFSLSTEWREYTFTISAQEENQGKTRVSFNFENTGTAWFDDFSMALATKSSFNDGEDLAQSNIKRTTYSQRALFSDQRISDMAEFYINIQQDYYQDMVNFLKNEIGVKIPITGTNALVGPADVLSQLELDYIDDHAYWDHPQFPNNPWDNYDWKINNEPMLESLPGTIGNIMSGLALSDRPYTISEYNHPYPNRYQTEMLPIIAAYMSLHEVDGIMFFNYHDGPYDQWNDDVMNSYFEINRNNAVMSLMPIYGHVYREGLINPATQQLLIQYTPESVYQMHGQDNSGRWGKYIPYDKTIAYHQSVKTQSYDTGNTVNTGIVPNSNTSSFSTAELDINGDHGILVINAPQIQSISGNIHKTNNLSTDYLHLNTVSDFGQVGILSLDGNAIPDSKKLLLFTGTEQKNTGMLWDGNMTVHNNWGTSPTWLKSLHIDLTLELQADSIRIHPLNAKGETADASFKVLPETNGTFHLTIDQDDHQTPWFGVETFSATTAVKVISRDVINIAPNPAKNSLRITWPAYFEVNQIELLNVSGQIMVDRSLTETLGQYKLIVDDIPTGSYLVRLKSSQQQITKKVFISN